MWKVPLFDLNYDERENRAVLEVLNSKWLTMGPKTKEYEDAFSRYLGGGVYSLAVSSCTAALHMALLAGGVKAGDEVIISGLTFVADLNVTVFAGATPVLADSKSFGDWNVSPEDIKTKITPRTKALIIVHYGGYPCDLDEIAKIAEDNGLLLIEDVAHAVGAEYKGRKCGVFGHMACFSSFSNKNLSTGEGGMAVTGDRGLYEKLKLLRSHGMTSMTIERHAQKAVSYDVVTPGLNYRIDEIRAALGLEQLKKLDESNLKRKDLTEQYRRELAGAEGLIIPWNEPLEDKTSSYHIFTVLLPEGADRKAVIEHLKDRGVQTSIHYPAFGGFTYYRDIIKEELKIAAEISDRVLTLPLYPTMRPDDVSFVADELKRALNG